MSQITLSPAMQAPATRAVFDALEAAGGAGCVRFVGGCVRNVLLGREESDLDLSTQLIPDEVEAALKAAGIRSVPTGKAFGTITAVVDGEPYEITSLREDVETDGRRAVVRYTTDWSKDALRRDFYINALYADSRGELYDPTGQGLTDATERRVRLIGEPEQRLREDYLRILRFFRFSAAYASTLDADSLTACVTLKAGIDALSGERITQELLKLMAVADPVAVVKSMIEKSVMAHILPGSRWADTDITAFKRVTALSRDAELRLLVLIRQAGLGYPQAISQLRQRLRFSNRLSENLLSVHEIVPHILTAGDDAYAWRVLLYRYGADALKEALWVVAAEDGWGADDVEARIRNHLVASPPHFPLKGVDIMRFGIPAGPEVGARLKAIETQWIDHDFSQTVIDQALDDLRKANKI